MPSTESGTRCRRIQRRGVPSVAKVQSGTVYGRRSPSAREGCRTVSDERSHDADLTPDIDMANRGGLGWRYCPLAALTLAAAGSLILGFAPVYSGGGTLVGENGSYVIWFLVYPLVVL